MPDLDRMNDIISVATVLTLWLIIAYCMWGGNDHAKR